MVTVSQKCRLTVILGIVLCCREIRFRAVAVVVIEGCRITYTAEQHTFIPFHGFKIHIEATEFPYLENVNLQVHVKI